MIKLPIKLLSDTAKLPTQGSEGAAAWDLYADTEHSQQELQSFSDKTTKVGTGVAIAIPKGYVGLLFARSSLYSRGLELSNAVGVIDSDYRGEIKMSIKNTRHVSTDIVKGLRMGQIVIIKHEQIQLEPVNQLTKTERGDGGFGSTGDL